MCAILGVISKSDYQQFYTTELWQMCEIQSHRGPDDRGGIAFNIENSSCEEIEGEDYVKAKGFLGFQRLSIQDLSTNGHQPMLDARKKVAIVFNGEIYNFKELRIELKKQGYEFNSGTDTEVLLSLYLNYGLEKTLSLVNGMFGFIILDLRINKLYVVRDRFGIKPLYMANTDDAVLFSSEMKAFLKYHGFEAKLNLEAFEELLLFKENIKDTMFQEVEEIEPGTITIFNLETNSCHVEKYFDIENYSRKECTTSMSKLVDEAESILKKVVKRQLISDTRVGCQLSGGIDSSIITKICDS
ncbi:MAG: asparagine synthetase B, partial [Lachnospiraceae bacterium]|nr:asparagine synthetase B [Lachnospiraceae bacterium]